MASMMLRYVEGAIPGKAIKRKLTDSALAKKERDRAYESKRPDRKMQPIWKENRPWLELDFEKYVMTCSVCKNFYTGSSASGPKKLKGANTFITGCSNFRSTTISDHEISTSHKHAEEMTLGKDKRETHISKTPAAKALLSLKSAEREKMGYLFRNTHSILKNNRPLSDYTWLCELDKAKGVELGDTYINDKAVVTFSKSIANVERNITRDLLNNCNFFSFMMDGSTDISGDDQEAVYIRCSVKGNITERFLGIGSPVSTCSNDLKNFLVEMLDSYGVDIKEKLVGMGSDGASNMVGRKGGLATLLRQEINPELVNVHCFSHRLELAFRDVMKKTKLYDKLMTLLIGIYYFYTKQYKNKNGLIEAIKSLKIKGVMPCKVTGTRWLPHLSRGIAAFLKTFKAYEAHLCTISHTNPKAEGLVKIMLNKDMMCFILFLQEVLSPLMQLSLKLQTPSTSLGDSVIWVKAAVDTLSEYKSWDLEEISNVISTGTYQGIELKGKTPSMQYKNNIIEGLIDALETRFSTESDTLSVVNSSSKILHLDKWPTEKTPDFAVDELKTIMAHFEKTLTQADPTFSAEDALKEFKLLKNILHRRQREESRHIQFWSEVEDLNDLKRLKLVIELINCIPPTSVTCETTFSQMKLIKTSRRTSMKTTTLDDLLLVKLQSATVGNFNPDPAIDDWMITTPVMPRRPHYKRSSKVNETVKTVPVTVVSLDENEVQDLDSDSVNVDSNTDTAPNSDNSVKDNDTDEGDHVHHMNTDIDSSAAVDDVDENENGDEAGVDVNGVEIDANSDVAVHVLNTVYEKYDDDDFCEDFQSESENWSKLFLFSRMD